MPMHSPSIELKLANKGYYPLRKVAKSIGIGHTTLAGWLRTRKIAYVVLNGNKYVSWRSALSVLPKDVVGLLDLRGPEYTRPVCRKRARPKSTDEGAREEELRTKDVQHAGLEPKTKPTVPWPVPLHKDM